MTAVAVEGERQACRRAQTRLTVQVAMAITTLVVAIGGLSYYLLTIRQDSDIRAILTYGVTQARPGYSDPCLWVFVLSDGRLQRPSQSPAGFPLLDAMREHTNATMTIERDGTVYDVQTAYANGVAREAVFDERYQLADRRHALLSILIAEAVGLAVAVITGTVLARRAIAPLGRALAKQRQFVADASHELRTPLTRLHTRAQLLLRQRGGTLPPEIARELERLVDGARELNEVVDDLLVSATLSADAAERDRIDLGLLAADVVDAETPRSTQCDVTVKLDQGPGDAYVYGVETSLRRMISALVDNAIGHTPPGGHISVGLRSADHGHAVELTVADDGVGFDPADRQRVFDRFARGTAGQGRRFGLGLALVREIVESHDGRISATGRPGHGASFTVRLPTHAGH